MKKLILALFMIVCSLSIMNAETNGNGDLQLKVDSLTVRVDSLSKELAYLKINFEMYKLNNDLNVFAIEINDNYQNICEGIYRESFHEDLYNQYERLYDVYKERVDQLDELIAVKYVYNLSFQSLNHLPEDGVGSVSSNYDTTIYLLKKIKVSMDNTRTALDGYYKLMKMKKKK